MNEIADPSKLQRLILAALEEAGEDHLSALMNTVISGRGRRAEVTAMRDALQGLQSAGLIRLARSRDKATLELVPLDESQSRFIVQSLESYLAWSDSKNIWTLLADHSDIEILLTEAGKMAARRILSEGGLELSKVTI
jgi:hypothetical protein